jgi:hypothetical protein
MVNKHNKKPTSSLWTSKSLFMGFSSMIRVVAFNLSYNKYERCEIWGYHSSVVTKVSGLLECECCNVEWVIPNRKKVVPSTPTVDQYDCLTVQEYGTIFLWNIWNHLPRDTASYSRRPETSPGINNIKLDRH